MGGLGCRGAAPSRVAGAPVLALPLLGLHTAGLSLPALAPSRVAAGAPVLAQPLLGLHTAGLQLRAAFGAAAVAPAAVVPAKPRGAGVPPSPDVAPSDIRNRCTVRMFGRGSPSKSRSSTRRLAPAASRLFPLRPPELGTWDCCKPHCSLFWRGGKSTNQFLSTGRPCTTACPSASSRELRESSAKRWHSAGAGAGSSKRLKSQTQHTHTMNTHAHTTHNTHKGPESLLLALVLALLLALVLVLVATPSALSL